MLCILTTCILPTAELTTNLHVPYSPENKAPPLFDLKFLHRYFYFIYKPLPLCCKNCTVSKNECLVIDKNAVIRSLNDLFSPLVSSFCSISWLKHGNKLKSSLDGRDGLANGLASIQPRDGSTSSCCSVRDSK